jgi:hypothetical protein
LVCPGTIVVHPEAPRSRRLPRTPPKALSSIADVIGPVNVPEVTVAHPAAEDEVAVST